MEDFNENDRNTVYSKKVRAGKRRNYFFDIKNSKNGDYYIVLTELKRKEDQKDVTFFEKHKIFLYKEDFNKFFDALGETIDYVKTELLPDYDYDTYNKTRYNNVEGETEHYSDTPENEEESYNKDEKNWRGNRSDWDN
ncbi:MAG: DUF3276 family protein [Chitinophagaceae bacterium]|nr:DUF3276 family protein [Chitinophagaceae bacterium]